MTWMCQFSLSNYNAFALFCILKDVTACITDVGLACMQWISAGGLGLCLLRCEVGTGDGGSRCYRCLSSRILGEQRTSSLSLPLSVSHFTHPTLHFYCRVLCLPRHVTSAPAGGCRGAKPCWFSYSIPNTALCLNQQQQEPALSFFTPSVCPLVIKNTYLSLYVSMYASNYLSIAVTLCPAHFVLSASLF